MMRHHAVWLVVTACLVVLPIAGWSAFWLYARSRVATYINALANAPPGSPLRLVCGERGIGGFPFDLVVTCRDPNLIIAGDAGPVEIGLSRLFAKASLFTRDRIALDLTGPLTAKDAAGLTQAKWTAMRIEIDGLPDVRRVAVHGADLSLFCEACYEPMRASQVGTLDLALERRGTTRDYAFAVSADGLRNASLFTLTANDRPANFAATGTIAQFEFPRSLRLAAEAERWRVAGGSVTFERAALDQAAMRVQVAGTFGLDAYHRPRGTFRFGARNAAVLMSGFTRSLSPLLQLAIGTALRNIDLATANAGDKGVDLPGRIENGSVSLGPLRGVASIAPLY